MKEADRHRYPDVAATVLTVADSLLAILPTAVLTLYIQMRQESGQ